MPQDGFKPKLGRMRDGGGARLLKHTARVFRQAGRTGVRALRQKGHVSPSALRRGMGAGDDEPTSDLKTDIAQAFWDLLLKDADNTADFEASCTAATWVATFACRSGVFDLILE